jgi:hypothetical protein
MTTGMKPIPLIAAALVLAGTASAEPSSDFLRSQRVLTPDEQISKTVIRR